MPCSQENEFPYAETQSLASELSDTKPSSFVPWNNVDNTDEIEIVQVDSP